VGGAVLMPGDREVAATVARQAGQDLWAADDAEPLPRQFFAGSSVEVAPLLLGCVLAHRTAAGLVAVLLTEVEAYAGAADPASHAFRGRTARNAVMFGPPGHAYVYFTYGMHFCVNLVCRPAGEASAVLLRAGRVIDGVGLAASRRGRRAPAGAGPARPASAPLPAAEAAAVPGADARAVPGSAAADVPGAEAAAVPGTEAAAVPGLVPVLSAAAQRDLARGPARLCQALGIDRTLAGADVCGPASPLRISAARPPVDPARIRRGPRVGVSSAADVAWRFWIADEPAVSPYRPHVPRHARAKPVSGGQGRDGTMPG
jgi:DNA-3-methyladenine glycosylase